MPADAIRVFCRVRPSKRPSGFFIPDTSDGVVHFSVPPDVERDVSASAGSINSYKFSGVFDGSSTQEDVFDVVAKEAVDAAVAGFNSTVFAYGQTGSGKTFSITGGAERYADRGIIPRALARIFTATKADSKSHFTVRVSYLEIYNENAYDLLDPSQETKTMEELPRVVLLEDEDGTMHMRGLSAHVVSSEEEALNLLFLGDTNRAIAETPLNLASSRSHCIFTLTLEGRVEGTPLVRRAKLHLVDLAGSERTGKTGAGGTLFREATHINKSLHFLEMVIVALQEAARRGGARGHIPYRNSLMTSMLRDSLGGNCKTTMLATINPEQEHTDESISTCRFAQRVARVTNVAVMNQVTDPAVLARQLRARVAELEQELAFKAAAAAAEGGDEAAAAPQPLTADEKETLAARARKWVEASLDDALPLDLGMAPTMEAIRVALGALRDALRAANASAAAAAAKGGGDADSDLLAALREEVRRLGAKLVQRDGEVTSLLAKLGEANASAAPATQPAAAAAAAAAPKPVTVFFSLPDGTRVTLELLADATRALEAFRGVYPARDAIEDNKALLRARYDAAKVTADRVNGSRDAIARAKSEIERARVERAVQGLTTAADEAAAAAAARTEAALVATVELHKGVYKKGYDELRELKSDIERIQRLLEGARLKLQVDFEAWRGESRVALMVAALPVPNSPNRPRGGGGVPFAPSALLNASISSLTSIGTTTSGRSSLASLAFPPVPACAPTSHNTSHLNSGSVSSSTWTDSSSLLVTPPNIARSGVSAPGGSLSIRNGGNGNGNESGYGGVLGGAGVAAPGNDVEDDIAAFYALKAKTAAAKK